MINHRSHISILLVLIFLTAFAFPSNADIRTVEGFVRKVADGDTVTLVTRDGAKLRVRLYGIDAPEVWHGEKLGQPYGEEAKRALAGKVLRKNVILTIQDTDQYKRMVGSSV